ncbi:MAG: ATP-binding cassette domain-containing protein [bacterium]
MSGPVPLVVDSLTRRFGDFTLQDISLEVRPAEYVAVVGQCGAGKTLLLETIAGFHPHGRRTVLLHGRDAGELPPEKRELALLCQGDTLFPHLSVNSNIRFGLRYLDRQGRQEAEARIENLLALLGIEQLARRRDIRSLSGGERQLVALARALAPGPRLLLVDEPLHSLDVSFKRRVMEVLARIPGETGVSILHITHDLGEVADIADRIVVLAGGRLLQDGRLSELQVSPASRFVAELVGAENLFEIPAGQESLIIVGCRVPMCSPPPGDPVRFIVLDPTRLAVRSLPEFAKGNGCGRVVAIREGENTVELVVAGAGHQLVVRASVNDLEPELLRLGAPVRIELSPAAVHTFREQVA